MFTEVILSDQIYRIYNDGRVEFPRCPLESIVSGLSREGRFSNQTPKHYSVAEHSVNVAARVYQLTGSPIDALCGLWHESGEALGWRDTNSPLTKYWGKKWKQGESHVLGAVFGRLGLPYPYPDIVTTVDHEFAAVEGMQLLSHSRHLWKNPGWIQYLFCWSPEKAAAEFRQANRYYRELIC